MIGIKALWAKTEPFQSVVTHGLVSGIIAQELMKHFLCAGTVEQLSVGLKLHTDQLAQFLGYFVSLHDIGKIHYYFQSKELGIKEELCTSQLRMLDIPGMVFRHEKESRNAVKRIWRQRERRTASILADILAAHHQGKPAAQEPETPDIWVNLQEIFEQKMREYFLQEDIFPKIERGSSGALSAILLGMVILSDWIASGEYFSEAEDWEDVQQITRSKAERFLQESGLWKTEHAYGDRFCQVWPNIPKGGERELQLKMESLFQNETARYSLILAEAPMGEGKTEAGVYAALQMAKQWGKNGFYVALPTSATANQMVGRIRSLFQMHAQDAPVKLLHAMAWMADDVQVHYSQFQTEEDMFARNWLMPLRRGLLAPYAVGTVDQAMMAAMFVKYGVLRLLGLSGKAVIIDEIHAYDTYMQNILEGLLRWCKALEIPVVLLSATLPPEKKQRLFSVYTDEKAAETYPSITAISQNGELSVIPITRVAKEQKYKLEEQAILHNTEKIADFAVRKAGKGGCACVLLNTVSQAQEVYKAIRKRNFNGKLMLFHSRFPAERRDEIEKECVSLFGKDKSRRPQRAILVATQVVEQSLDVDFDDLISAIAPMDLLIQRMGRQYRHEDTPRPEGEGNPTFTVLTPEDSVYGADGYVYPECLLKQTEYLLKNREVISVPQDIAGLVADAYNMQRVPPEELEKWMENLVNEEIQGAMADRYKLSSPDKKFRPLVDRAEYDDLEQQSYLSAQTRLSEPTVTIALLDDSLYAEILPMVQEGILPIKNLSLARKILGKSVSVRRKIYDKKVKQSDLLDISGDMLIAGIKILSEDNPCFQNDRELGLIWKEETK